jgi:hypothetical protein
MFDPACLPANEEIVEAFLRVAYENAGTSLEPWPTTAVRLLSARDPARVWDVLCLLIERASGEVLAGIGTSELENFLTDHAAEYIDRIEERARLDRNFVVALANAWMTRGAFPPDVEDRLLHASQGCITFLDGVGDETWGDAP